MRCLCWLTLNKAKGRRCLGLIKLTEFNIGGYSKGYVFIFKNGSFKPKHKFLTKLVRAFCCKYVDCYPKFLLSLSLHHVFNFMSSLLLPWVMLPPPKVSMPTRFLRQKNGKLWQNPSWMIANGNSAPEETWTTVLYSFFEG